MNKTKNKKKTKKPKTQRQTNRQQSSFCIKCKLAKFFYSDKLQIQTKHIQETATQMTQLTVNHSIKETQQNNKKANKKTNKNKQIKSKVTIIVNYFMPQSCEFTLFLLFWHWFWEIF